MWRHNEVNEPKYVGPKNTNTKNGIFMISQIKPRTSEPKIIFSVDAFEQQSNSDT